MPFSLIPFLLLAIPVAEIAVFIVVGGQIGVLWTFATILLTAIIGSILLRVQGFQILNKLREETNAGRIPGKELGHGIMILMAGILLLTPGFVTDTIGFLLFIPFVRTFIWSLIASKVRFVGPIGGFGSGPNQSYTRYRRDDEDIVDLDPDEFEDLDSESIRNTTSPWNKRLEEDDQVDRKNRKKESGNKG